MWLFTKRAFLSAVEYNPNMDKTGKGIPEQPPTGLLLVRARVKEDLEDLRDVYTDLVIEEDTYADYQYRALISRYDFAQYMLDQIWDIDYGSHFKEVVQANATQPGPRHSAMMKVWNAMMDLQPVKPYQGSAWGYDPKDSKYWKDPKNTPAATGKPAAVSPKAQGPAKTTVGKTPPKTTPPAKPVETPEQAVKKHMPATTKTPADVAAAVASRKKELTTGGAKK